MRCDSRWQALLRHNHSGIKQTMSSICLVAENRAIQEKQRVTRKGSEYCKEGTGFVLEISKHSSTGYVLYIGEARLHSRVSPFRICGGQSGTVTGFCPSTSVLPCQRHSTKTPDLVQYSRSYIILESDCVLRQYALLFHIHSLFLSVCLPPPLSILFNSMNTLMFLYLCATFIVCISQLTSQNSLYYTI
jgi:hypothetical protein